jgi:preprotein translocase subunit Sss1
VAGAGVSADDEELIGIAVFTTLVLWLLGAVGVMVIP